MQLTGDPLLWLDDQAGEETYLPRLATGWEISEDMLTYTFHLAEGVTWHDDAPFTAEDVAFDFTTQCDARLNASGYVANWSKIEGAPAYFAYTDALAKGAAEGMAPVEGVSGIRVIDEYTVSITLSEVYAPFLSGALNGFILYPKHIWEQIPVADWSTCDQLQTPVGTGAYARAGGRGHPAESDGDRHRRHAGDAGVQHRDGARLLRQRLRDGAGGLDDGSGPVHRVQLLLHGEPAGGRHREQVPLAMPVLDELMIAGTRTTDRAERTALYYEIAHILNENQPECWLYSPNQIRASRPELQNYALNNSCEFLDVQNWYFESAGEP